MRTARFSGYGGGGLPNPPWMQTIPGGRPPPLPGSLDAERDDFSKDQWLQWAQMKYVQRHFERHVKLWSHQGEERSDITSNKL